MNFRKLEAFITVIEKKSFSDAAAALKGSQPAISLKIKSLEDELEIELLDRSHSGIQPTPAGTHVYIAAKVILQKWEQLEDELRGFHEKLTGTLTIGASTIPGTYLIPSWIKKFRQLYPKVDVAIEISDSKTILNKLLDHQVDVGITGLLEQSNKMISRPVASDSLVLIIPNEFSYSQSNELDFTQLKQFDIVLREEGSGTRKEMEEFLSRNGYTLADFNTSISFSSSEAVISAVEAGLGISFVSKLAATPAARAKRIKIVETLEPYQRSFYFSVLSESENRPIIREFSDVLLIGVAPEGNT